MSLINTLPQAGGLDTSDATATAGDIVKGYTGYGSAGTKITGTLEYVGTYTEETQETLKTLTNTTSSAEGGDAGYIGNYAVIGPGVYNRNISAYSNTLTLSETFNGYAYFRGYCLAVSGTEYIIFAGGLSNGYVAVVEAVNSSLTLTRPTNLTTQVADCSGGHVRTTNKYFFIGGNNNNNKATSLLQIYDSSLTKTSGTSYGAMDRVSKSACASCNDHVIISGGYNHVEGRKSDLTISINGSGTITEPAKLPEAINGIKGTGYGYWAYLAGGNGASSSKYLISYNAALTEVVTTNLTIARYNICINRTLNGYILLACGFSSAGSNVIERSTENMTVSLSTITSRNYGSAVSTFVPGRSDGGILISGGNPGIDAAIQGTMSDYITDYKATNYKKVKVS